MTIVKLKAASWVNGEILTPAQINALNDLLPDLPDMVNGSTHTPGAPVRVLGPHGLEVENLVGGTYNLSEVQSLDLDVPIQRLESVYGGGVQYWAGPSIQGAGSLGGIGGTIPERAAVRQTGVSDYHVHMQVPPLPRGSIITGASMLLCPMPGHSGLPATLPYLWLNRYNATGKIPVALGGDQSGNLTAYEQPHTVTAGLYQNGAYAAYDPAYSYEIEIRGESGTNSRVHPNGWALVVFGVRIQFTLAELRA